MSSLVYIAVICVLLCTAFSGLDGIPGKYCKGKGKLYPLGHTFQYIKNWKCPTWICNNGYWKVHKTGRVCAPNTASQCRWTRACYRANRSRCSREQCSETFNYSMETIYMQGTKHKKEKRPTKIRDVAGNHPTQDRYIRVTHLRVRDNAPAHCDRET
ncbi:hypothetical protein PoB_004914500 [Plakobranchus ocellatus]|uniref:Uncharacterized protein n=1 Tax=Plakobranchus ocellatus TaxID=259542 RepID=A0AAV4BTL3_9GAST|nr:hypothetical protein PoB_004914500 [Plakobranchus ocellatus]